MSDINGEQNATGYESLMDQERFQEAADALIAELEVSEDDEKRRALACCFLQLDRTKDAIEVIRQIDNLGFRDYALLARGYWRLSNWEEMAFALKSMLNIKETAFAYHHLAVAEARGRYNYELDEASKEIIRGYLSNAIELEDCDVSAFLWLAKIYEPTEIRDRVGVLTRALDKHPDNPQVRYELASMYIHHEEDFIKALDTLTPLLEDGHDDKASWYSVEALIGLGRYDEAISQLESIEFENPLNRERIKADILFRKGNLSDWLIYSEQFTDDGSSESSIRRYFRKAYFNLQNDCLGQALKDFSASVDLIFKTNTIIDNYVYFPLGGTYLGYVEHDVVLDVCETLVLLYTEQAIPDEVLGLALCVIHWLYHGKDRREEISNLLGIQAESLLLHAAELLNYRPEICGHLAYEFCAPDLPRAIDYHLTHCLWAHRNDADYESKFLPEYVDRKDEATAQKASKKQEIHEVALKHLESCNSAEEIERIFLPFYNSLWREVLFQGEMFQEVIDVSRIFIECTGGNVGLFDYAYSLSQIGRTDEAEKVYRRLIEGEPESAAAINNLAVIYENRGSLDEARYLFGKAVELQPSEELYQSNLNRVTEKIAFYEKAQRNAEAAYDEIWKKALNAGLTLEQQRAMSESYWDDQIPIKEIQELFGIRDLYKFIVPVYAGLKCPNCSVELVYKTRTARKSGDAVCLGCGHKSHGWCRCDYCRRIEEERRKQQEEARRRAALEEFKKLKEKYCKSEYVEWAISKLTRKQKKFLKAFIEVVDNLSNPTWQIICERAGVVSEKSYRKKLESLKLLLVNPEGGIVYNSAIGLDMLELETVRKISPSLRFEVFQRDKHTCQYCGRKPPEAVLEVDHLIPVSKGGMDDFDNLVTSCKDCNAGKSDKLIEQFTGGYSKDEWREQIRAKRIEILRERRERIDEIVLHWQECLGRRHLREGDKEAIHKFIELYDPEWIKAAISIAAKKRIRDYVPYTGGILRNWAKDGPPDYLSDPDAYLDSRSATEKQMEYIQSLLDGLGLKLSEFYPKDSCEELTMLDAKNLIEALSGKREESGV